MASATGFALTTGTTVSMPHSGQAARSMAPKASIIDSTLPLLAEIVDASGERAYGAVDAPGWVAPVAGVGAIITALLPVLLAPGEEAFTRQQQYEDQVKGRFKSRQGK